MGTVFLQQALGMVRTILFLFLMSFMPDPGSTLPPTSFASTALTNYIRNRAFINPADQSTSPKQITSAHLFSIYNKAKSKRAFTSFRFRNRKNPARIFESEQKRWLQLPHRLVQPLNLLGPEALQELTTLKGGYKQANKT